MITQLTGTVLEKIGNQLTLDVNGVGYVVELTTGSMSSQPSTGSQTSIKTYLHVREDCWQLFGFSTKEEKIIFEKLINISGIGPKLAMNILSSNSIEEFKSAIANEDVDILTSVPRLGSKNAKRIILELKDKLVAGDEFSDPHYKEAQQALLGLGYTNAEIKKTLSLCNGEQNTEELVKAALKNLANG